MDMVERISFAQAKEILDTDKTAVLLDVRTEEEYAAQHAAGALLLPLDEITQETAEELLPDMDTPILLYCRTGRRSNMAALKLYDLGYNRLYDLGGLNGWPYGMDYGI